MSRNKNVMLMGAEISEEGANWNEVLDEYLDYLRGCGRSPRTVEGYRDHVSRFYRTHDPKWDDERKNFLSWNAELHIHTNHRLDSCKRFWEWARREGHRQTNPADNVERRLINRNTIANVNINDIQKIIVVFKKEFADAPGKWERIRNYAFVLLSIGTGVRPGEGLLLRRGDFNLPERQVVVRGEHVKTRQSRVIYLPQEKTLLNLLKKMIAVQSASGVSFEAPLFSDSGGRALSSRTWFHIFSKRAKEAEVSIKPYDLRHAFITHSLIEGANPYDLRDQVGHSNMEMMKRYFHSNADARRETANRSPLLRLATGKKV